MERSLQWKRSNHKAASPRIGGERSDLLQLFDHGSITNVPGVKNVIDAFKMSSDHRIKSAVGVGNHSDPKGSVLVHGATTG
jgi:hypothetical protein